MGAISKSLLAAVSALILTAPPCDATRIRVDPGGSGDVLTIAAAMATASSGDTVAVRSGNHSVVNVEVVPGVQLLGGWDPTFATRTPGTSHLVAVGGHALQCTVGQNLDTLIDGFEITGASNSAIFVDSSSPTIRQNQFHSNTGQDGAAIHCESGASPLIESNHIHHNFATYGGGIRGHLGFDTSPTIRNNLIEWNTAVQAGGGIGVNNGSPIIEDNVIRWNSANGTGGGIHVWHGEGGVVEIRRNLIAHNDCRDGGGIGINGGHPLIENNTLWDNSAYRYGGAISQATSIYFDPNVTRIENNIIAGTTAGPGIECIDDFSMVIACTCFWGNVDGDHLNTPASVDDILQDPQFCSVGTDDFTLRSTSPCAPGASSCGLVGAYPVACGPVSIEASSWARIKENYR